MEEMCIRAFPEGRNIKEKNIIQWQIEISVLFIYITIICMQYEY